MKMLFTLVLFSCFSSCSPNNETRKVFDAHLHGSSDILAQVKKLTDAGVYKAAVSTSWDLQSTFSKSDKIDFLYGLMFPCPEGKVPYSLQPCYSDGKDWPSPEWVEQQIKEGKIDFFGEILSQYYGISSSDSLLFPYYSLAERYKLPVGIHTGGAGPDHGSPNFKMELGDPALIKDILVNFPALKLWIMHSGDQHYKKTIALMQEYRQLYSDISVISNPDIVPPEQFKVIMKAFADAKLIDRLLFGTDNGDVVKVILAVEELDFLTADQKEDIFYRNAERFFGK